MPVEIVDDNGGVTSTDDGSIQLSDLQKMTQDYKTQIALTALPPRYTIRKRDSFYFSKNQVLALFAHFQNNPDANAIEVAIGIQVPNTLTECRVPDPPPALDNSHCLAVIISMANKDVKDPYNSIGDYVLINGYHSPIALGGDDECCPGSKPPPPTSSS